MRTFGSLVAVAAAAVLLAAPAASQDDGAPRPTYTIGHIWPHRDAAYELVRVENDVYLFASPDAEIRLTKSLGLAGFRRGDEFLELTPGAELVWPLKPGDWGTSRTE